MCRQRNIPDTGITCVSVCTKRILLNKSTPECFKFQPLRMDD
ncbi:Protein of unknown function [Pyronema omphalodes CBS 100304]|uniref:Uncharacterized protein n=1 Tax=Pyronema omphalodes (strain CBS 100304) TaxID=1076935 RepID=U4L5H7_PYROM|nr:Protein of unknown function [Pyronema omphalodes CBS 100304]